MESLEQTECKHVALFLVLTEPRSQIAFPETFRRQEKDMWQECAIRGLHCQNPIRLPPVRKRGESFCDCSDLRNLQTEKSPQVVFPLFRKVSATIPLRKTKKSFLLTEYPYYPFFLGYCFISRCRLCSVSAFTGERRISRG